MARRGAETQQAVRGLRHDGLITNLTLETKGFKELPTDWSELTDQILSMNRGVSSPTKSCWVLVNGQCNVRGASWRSRASSMPRVFQGDIVLGKLSHHPAKSTHSWFSNIKHRKVYHAVDSQ